MFLKCFMPIREKGNFPKRGRCIPQVKIITAGMIISNLRRYRAKGYAVFTYCGNISEAMLADIWQNKQIITVDGSGEDFLGTVKNGDKVESADGR